MRYECCLGMAWSDTQQLQQVRRVHVGPWFDVFRAGLDDRDVAIKRHSATMRWDDALVSVWTHSDPSRR